MPILPSRRALAAAVALALCSAAHAASHLAAFAAAQPSLDTIEAARGQPNLLILPAGVFDPLTQALDAGAVGAASETAATYAIVQFQPGRTAERKALAARGVEFLGYVPNDAYYARLNGVTLSELAQDPAVRWAGPVQPAMKLDPTLWQARRANSAARQSDGRYEVIVHGFAGVSSSKIQALLTQQVPGLEITMRSQRAEAMPYVRAKTDAASLDALLRAATAIDGVQFVLPWYPAHITNTGSIGALQGDATTPCDGRGAICGPSPMFDHGIVGGGQIIAVADTGTTPNAAWFSTLDKGNGPHTEVTFSDDPPPVLPNPGTLHPNNKIIGYWLQPGGPTNYDLVSGHGTHTTGTVVGDAAGEFSTGGTVIYDPSTPMVAHHDIADGMAPNAQLLMQDAGPDSSKYLIFQDFEGTLAQAYAGGAHVHSDSWGSSTSGQYTGDDANVDRATRKAENLLVVIAAGNDQAGAMATGSPANSKNGVTVAALGHAGDLNQASFSNDGPTADGRMKPDVAAPGTSTISALNSTDPITTTILAPQMTADSGTSMATPVVAGNAVLLREYFVDGFYPRGFKNTGGSTDVIFVDGFEQAPPRPAGTDSAVDAYNPTGAVMKAVLLNSTVQTTSPATFPNTGTGWGRPWLDNNLWFKDTLQNGDDSRRMRVFERTNNAGLKTGEINEYTIANIAPGIEFRATLTWFDPPAVAGAASTLINNLDLEVVDPNGQVYLGNHFSGNVSTTGGTADAKDTVEQVRFTAPIAGSYTIRVKATDVPGTGELGTDQQGYGLAVSGSFGLPDTAALAAPTAVSIAGNGTGGISVGATASGSAQSYQLYRADGTCAAAATGDFHLVANGATLPLTDDHTQGGYSYAYKVRGVQNDVEGEASACIDVVSLDDCTLQPTFDRQSVAADASNATCSVDLTWSAATANCPAASTVTYKLERDTDPYFGNPQTLAAALTAATYSDATVTNGTPYFYRVTATDGAGNSTPASVATNATPSGVDGPDPGSYVDDVDTHSYLVMESPWQVTDTSASAGTYSYHNAIDDQVYADNVCASITTPPLTLTTGAALSFQAKYDLEFEWDGVVQEISTDGGATWTDLPPTGGYPSSFAQTLNPPVNACGYAASHGAFNGVSTAASNADPGNGTATAVFKPFATSLASYVGQTVQLRWRFSSDGSTAFDGFFLDQVQISGAAGTGDYMCH